MLLEYQAANYGYSCQYVRILGVGGGNADIKVKCNNTYGCTGLKIETEFAASLTVDCIATS